MAAKMRKTPGVYITEQDAYPPSIVGVETAVPVFIGYTEQAEVGGKSVTNKPIEINSLAEFTAIFGSPPKTKVDLVAAQSKDFSISVTDGDANDHYYKLTATPAYNLAAAMRLFFVNGGAKSYVVSVGSYSDAIELERLQTGLKAAGKQTGATLTVTPEATLLSSADFGTLAVLALRQANDLKDRFVVLDLFGANALDQSAPNFGQALEDCATKHRGLVGSENLEWGASYFPPLHTSVIASSDLDFTWFDPKELTPVLELQAKALYAKNDQLNAVLELIKNIATPPKDPAKIAELKANLSNALPILSQLLNTLASELGILPPSAGIAGIIAQVDNNEGVWKAPANISMTSVIAPTLKIDSQMQGGLNDPLDGKAIDVIREFPGRGVLVWGARTMAGNSPDWRYIPVRRTVIYIEQSIEVAMQPFVFAANDGNTWSTVTASISNFLHGLWSQGGLYGSTASEAYSVECGLGSTMTAQDILDGYMIVQVRLQLIRPDEFIVLNFKQKMSES